LADFVEAGLKSPQKPEQTSVGEAC
ncbi:ubiquinone anaerobic biosynthesis accessory factor UbiT, partial [Klebsiella pneumoniae]